MEKKTNHITPENERFSMKPIKNDFFAKIGKMGGLKKSDKKAKAARENGKKGGRPKK